MIFFLAMTFVRVDDSSTLTLLGIVGISIEGCYQIKLQ
jgi:hypothetical protein